MAPDQLEDAQVVAPDVPSVPNDTVGLPDACPTPAEGDTHGPGTATPALRVNGTLLVRPMRVRRERGQRHVNPDLRELLAGPVPPDAVIEAEADATISIVDADVHHWTSLPADDELAAHLAAIRPVPDAAWFSHGRGLKLVYTGPHHHARAVGAAFSVPPSFTVELLTHTRHPASTSTAHPGASCGSVVYPPTDPMAQYSFEDAGRLSPESRAEALATFELEAGGRYDHERCPIEPSSDSAAANCVSVLDSGVYCHRCAARGTRYSPELMPGFLPFAAIVGGAVGDVGGLARDRVHWRHASLVLRHRYPHLHLGILEEAYRFALVARSTKEDPRIRTAFNPDLDFVYSEGGWVDAATLNTTRVDNDAADGLPAVQRVISSEDGEPKVVIDRVKRSQVKNRAPLGYPPIRVVRGITFRPDGDAIPVVAPPPPRHEIELLPGPIPDEDVAHQLGAAFPRLDARYLRACLAAVICAEAGHGPPPMLACSGPSGSGKELHIRLAASFMGQDVSKLSLTDDEEKFARQLGASIATGHRFLIFDELAKTRNLVQKLKNLLQINNTVSWRPLYRDGLVNTPNCASFFFPCVRFPDFLTISKEFVRRTRHVFLYRELPYWGEQADGDVAGWRDLNEHNATLANSFLTHVWQLCRAHCFRFTAVADTLELGSLADGNAGVDPEVLRSLYRYARDEDGQRVLFENDTTFVRGWVNLDAPRVTALISPLVALDDADNLRRAKSGAQANLEALAWNDVLGIEAPPIRCRIKIHGARWGLRFQSAEPALRGREAINEDLPAIADTQPASGEGDEPVQTAEDDRPGPETAADVLARGGLPS